MSVIYKIVISRLWDCLFADPDLLVVLLPLVGCGTCWTSHGSYKIWRGFGACKSVENKSMIFPTALHIIIMIMIVAEISSSFFTVIEKKRGIEGEGEHKEKIRRDGGKLENNKMKWDGIKDMHLAHRPQNILCCPYYRAPL